MNPSAAIVDGWSYLSGPPAAVLFADTTQAGTTVTFDQPGDYVLRLTATANALSNHADVTIHVVDTGPALAAIPDRQLALGATMKLVLAGSSPSVTETLSYGLDAQPAGSVLAPTPQIVWTPASGQLGANTFTARVTDSHGRSDATKTGGDRRHRSPCARTIGLTAAIARCRTTHPCSVQPTRR